MDSREAPLSWIAAAAFITGVVHAVLMAVLASAGGSYIEGEAAAAIDAEARVQLRLCEGRRCPFSAKRMPRRKLDLGTVAPVDLVLEVSLVPKLGLKEPDVKELPKLVKYEQPEVIQEAINIEKPPEVEEPPPIQEPRPQPPEVDKRRKKPRSLDDIIDAPRDDDPRKRASTLDNIVGVSSGTTYGMGMEAGPYDAVIARLQEELTRRMVVPSSLSDAELRRLKVRIRLNIEPNGTISSFKVVSKSGTASYDSAAEATVKRFMPSEGGSFKLADIPNDIRNHINQKVVFNFDGRHIRR